MRKKTIKIRELRIKDNWFENIFYLYIGDWAKTKEKIEKKWVNLTLMEDDGAKGRYFAINKEKRIVRFIWLEDFNWSAKWESFLAHETLHYVFASLKDKGFLYNADGEEAWTYYYQNIYREIISELTKKYE